MVAVVKFSSSLAMMMSLGYVAYSVLQIKAHRPVYERTALWFLFGSGLVSLCVFWVSLADSAVGLASTAVVAAMAALYAAVKGMQWGWRYLRGDRFRWAEWRWSWHTDWLPLGLSAVVVLLFVGIAWAAWSNGLRGDGLAIWGLKARVLWLEGGVPVSYFSDVSRQWSHLNYPLLVPVTEAWTHYFLGRDDEHFAQAVLLVFCLSLLGLFYGAMRRGHSRRYSWGVTLLLCITPAFYRMASSSYADVPLSVFILGSSISLYFWLKDHRSSDLWTAAVLSALCMWVKREGVVAWAINLAAIAIWVGSVRGQPIHRRVKAMLVYVLPSLLLAPWFLFLAWRAVPDNDFVPVGFVALASNLYRVPTVLLLFLAELASVEHWGVLWGLFLLSALYLLFKPGWSEQGKAYLFVTVSAYIAVMASVFVFSTWPAYEVHMVNSFDRLVFHVMPTAVFFIAVQQNAIVALAKERIQRLLFRWPQPSDQLTLTPDGRPGE